MIFPLKPKSALFGVIGDSGTGGKEQYEVAQEMTLARDKFPFEFVIMLGDNIYGGSQPADFERKFERPYKPLLDVGVTFFASLGHHDNTNERFYKLFNMGGKRYYRYRKGDVEFFALDSNYMDRKQLDWLEKQVRDSTAAWKICFFHHPLYSDGTTHGPDTDLRARVQPIFEKYSVKVVFSGHEHVYERIKPRNGIHYFVLGNSGKLQRKSLRASGDMAASFDADRTFMLVEIAGDEFYFQTISRTGQTADSGKFGRK